MMAYISTCNPGNTLEILTNYFQLVFQDKTNLAAENFVSLVKIKELLSLVWQFEFQSTKV